MFLSCSDGLSSKDIESLDKEDSLDVGFLDVPNIGG